MVRPKLHRTRHTTALDEETGQAAEEYFAELNAQLGGGLSWAGFLGGLVRDGLRYRSRLGKDRRGELPGTLFKGPPKPRRD